MFFESLRISSLAFRSFRAFGPLRYARITIDHETGRSRGTGFVCFWKKEDADVALGGLTAAAKANAGMVLKECADCAVLLFGGNGYTRSGRCSADERS